MKKWLLSDALQCMGSELTSLTF